MLTATPTPAIPRRWSRWRDETDDEALRFRVDVLLKAGVPLRAIARAARICPSHLRCFLRGRPLRSARRRRLANAVNRIRKRALAELGLA